MFAQKADILLTIVVRNNNPDLDSSAFDATWAKLQDSHRDIKFMFFNDGYNVGFGRGHNLNFDISPSEYFLILNDDIGFPHIDWLDAALVILENNERVALVGASQNPGSVTSLFGNGVFSDEGRRWPLRYAEASILLVRSKVFAEIGKFDDAYEWAMCEDADLSFRAQAHGYQLSWIDIPHEHWRSSSFNVLPSETKSSILEYNRSVLFSKWNVAFEENQIKRLEIFDLWSDGIGDVFCALLHLQVFVGRLTEQQRSLIVLNTSLPDLAKKLFSDSLAIVSFANQDNLREKYAGVGVHSYKSLRNANYGLPFNLHMIICTSLGIPVASSHQLSAIIKQTFVDKGVLLPQIALGEAFCVVHLESERLNHDGRSPSPLTIREIAVSAAEHFDHIVLVGKKKLLSENDLAGKTAKITDLQGQLSVEELIQVVASADAFVGIDSFPAHTAQLAGVRSAVFFGSIHPSFRVLSEGQTWPIVKPIECIGCYHISVEPSVPFCLRRDVSCTKDIESSVVRRAIAGCAELDAFDWRDLTAQSLELQRKFFTKLLFHPAPEKRFFAGQSVSNEMASNLIYRVIDQMQKAVSRSLPQSVAQMALELEELKAESFRKDLRVESMVKLIAELRR